MSLKPLIKRLIRKILKQRTHVIYNSYSQAGEDLIIKFLFDQLKIENLSYLEIGVYLPDLYNNTYLFYTNGAHGVCVEADETLIPAIKSCRSRDLVLNLGIGTGEAREQDFYIFDEKGLNTFSKEEAEYREKVGTKKITKVVKVPIITINEILLDNFTSCPHLLSIDIEGLDLAVLKTLDFLRFPIPVICVETCTYSENHIKPKDKAIEEFMLSKGYFVYGDTYINTIFVNSDWFYKSAT